VLKLFALLIKSLKEKVKNKEISDICCKYDLGEVLSTDIVKEGVLHLNNILNHV